MLSKEQDQNLQYGAVLEDLVKTGGALFLARTEAVEWLLKVNAFYGFSSLTALLAINYLDRVLTGRHFQRDKPWMLQLLAVTCISLAAKVEEVRVPVLQDLQVKTKTHENKSIFSRTHQNKSILKQTHLIIFAGGRFKVHFRSKNDTENGAFSAQCSSMEDARSDPCFISWHYNKRAWIKEESVLSERVSETL